MEDALNPPAPTGVPAYPGGASPTPGWVSPDGLWRWDGWRWLPTAPAPSPSGPSARPTGTRAGLAVVGLVVVSVAQLVSLIADSGRLDIVNRILKGETISVADATASDDFVRLSAVLELAALVVCAATFLVWLHRIVANNHALGAQSLQFTPGWAVGWWFVPIMNLARPFQVVAEAWRASDPRQPQSRADQRIVTPIPVYLRGWWILLLLGNVIARFAAANSGSSATVGSLHDATVADMVASVVLVTSALLGILLVHRLTQRQAAQRDVLRGQSVAG